MDDAQGRPESADVVRASAERERVDVDEVVEVRSGGPQEGVRHSGDDQPQADRDEALDRAGHVADGSPESAVPGKRPTAQGK